MGICFDSNINLVVTVHIGILFKGAEHSMSFESNFRMHVYLALFWRKIIRCRRRKVRACIKTSARSGKFVFQIYSSLKIGGVSQSFCIMFNICVKEPLKSVKLWAVKG